MSEISLHILLPGLLERTPEWAATHQVFPRFKSLERLLSRATGRPINTQGYEATLCQLFGIRGREDCDLPVATLIRLGYTHEDEERYCLCVTPVYLHADINQLFLQPVDDLDIAEAKTLAGLLSEHFAEQKWRLEVYDSQCWILVLDKPAQIKTHSLYQILYRDINNYLPTGPDSAFWCSILNEAQMLLHGVELNVRRRKQNKQPVNSLWVYGGGALPADSTCPYTLMASNEPLAVGCARLSNIPCLEPTAYSILTKDISTGSVIVALNSLQQASARNDYETWNMKMQHVTGTWFNPVWHALRARTISSCTIYDCSGQCFFIGTKAVRHFWQRTKPLYYFARERRG